MVYRQFVTKPVDAKVKRLQYKNTNPQNNYWDKGSSDFRRGAFLANVSLSPFS